MDKTKTQSEQLKIISDRVTEDKVEIRKMTEERDAVKKHLNKLLAKQNKWNSQVRICGNCTFEYNEKENFNWSCRVHYSDWGGEMWWCCGKRGKD